MTSYLQIENLTKSFGDRVLFSNITMGVFEGDKIGIIAKNGMGKSTLMNIIMGNESYDDGKIVFRNDLNIGHLEQLSHFDSEATIIDICLLGDNETLSILRKYEKALSNGDDIIEIVHEMDSLSAWDYEDRFKQILSQLKITDFNQKIKELSGGQLKKVAIAKVLINKPDILLLDEPTNHLDIDMIEWLESYLSRNRITLLMVTHDRYFLDSVCNKIIELDQNQIYTYNGNYDYYLEKRAERIEAQNAEIAKAGNLLRKELDWMRRQPQARATKAKYRIDAFYNLKDKAGSRNQQKDVVLADMKSSYIGSKIFEATKICKKFDDKIILDDFNYTFARYEKLGIVGENGVGKSTFIKILQGIVKPDSGIIDVGETVQFGYYGQEGLKFDETKKVLDVISEIAEVINIDDKHSYTASQFLQHFLFSPSDQQKLVAKLSGGEKRRLYLASVLMKKPNFLILDEPTNDLDIVTLEILEDYIEKFKGCVIIVSHDRFFMDRCIEHLFVLEGNGVIKDFPGNYSEFREWKKETEKLEEQTNKNNIQHENTIKPKSSQRNQNKLTYKEKIEFESLSKELEELEKEKTHLEAIFNGTIVEEKIDFKDTSTRFAEIKDLIDEKELRWLELSEKD